MDMDPAWAKVWTDWAQWGLGSMGAAALLVWGLFNGRTRAMESDLKRMNEQLDHRQQHMGERIGTVEQTIARCDSTGCSTVTPRMARLEEAVKAMPSHDDLARAHARIDVVANGVSRIEGHITGIASTVARIEGHLLEHGPRAGDTHR